ncbi:transposase [Amycolatopsis sp. NPDC051903]|uniref:transposase n=1 Tax=Amycolatopsis sp. NPDC051903 TaxID=3363936 RepID=UPI0037BB50E8
MVGRGELTDKAWAAIEPLPPRQGGGRQWRDHRHGINAILSKLRTGAPWVLPLLDGIRVANDGAGRRR